MKFKRLSRDCPIKLEFKFSLKKRENYKDRNAKNFTPVTTIASGVKNINEFNVWAN